MSSIKLDSLLAKHGLLLHTFSFNDLPLNIKNKLGDENQERYQDCYLSLIANAGPKFWTELKASQHEWNDNSNALDNPVDHFSAVVVEQLLQVTGLAHQAELLYPGTAPAPLMQLGELANWSTASPLGLGLHSHYGPWFAYRALVKTTDPLPVTTTSTNTLLRTSVRNSGIGDASNIGSANLSGNINNAKVDIEQVKPKHHYYYAANSPCMQCASTACVSACPGNAVSISAKFNIDHCAKYRLKENSTCEAQCHARNACPVGVEYRYSEEQQAHHMTRALQALVAWAKGD